MFPPYLWLSMMLVGHLMHTTVSEIVWDRVGGRAELRVRGFADDLGAAAAAADAEVSADSAVARYVRARFAVMHSATAVQPVATELVERPGDAIVVHLAVVLPKALHDVRIDNRLLTERFADQVNIVRVTGDGRALSLLFTGGESPKALP